MYHTHYAQVYLKLGQFAYGFDSGPKKDAATEIGTQCERFVKNANVEIDYGMAKKSEPSLKGILISR